MYQKTPFFRILNAKTKKNVNMHPNVQMENLRIFCNKIKIITNIKF